MLVFLLFYTLIFFTHSATSQDCYGNNFTPNSTFSKNREIALSALSSNVTSNTHCYTATVGQGPDMVYTLALCRGDYSAQTCYDCIKLAKGINLSGCTYQKEAITWGPNYERTCIVRHYDRPITNLLETQPAMTIQNKNNVSTNLNLYNQAWNDVMESLVIIAVAGNSSYDVKYFATRESNLGSSKTIYGMVQCTPDLSMIECRSCLSGAVNDFQASCSGVQGGSILKSSCFIRSDMYPFYATGNIATITTTNLIRGSAGENINTTLVMIITALVTAISVILIMSLITVFLWKRKPIQMVDGMEKIEEKGTAVSSSWTYDAM